MKILEIKVFNGPNVWSIDHPNLICIKLLFKHNKTTDQCDNFVENLIGLIPSLANFPCLCHKKENFLNALKEGCTLVEVIAHVACHLQEMVGMDCHYVMSNTSQEKKLSSAIFSYEIENAGLYAAKAAVKIVKSILIGKNYALLQKDLEVLKEIKYKEGLGPSTQSIVQAAKLKNIPYRRLNSGSLVMFGFGAKQKLINATATSNTNIIGVDMASEKDFTKEILAAAFIPVPKGIVISSIKELNESFKKLEFPLVIKPLDGNHGRGVTTNILNKEKAYLAYKIAKKESSKLLVEPFIEGFDYRFLVIDYKLVAVAKRIPASIIGDGNSTIKELITKVNEDPKRGLLHENVLTKIKIDETTLEILNDHGLNIESILDKDQILFLKHSANISTGGTAVDVTDEVHPETFEVAARIARLLNLDVCGIDVISKDISLPLTEKTAVILEVNASPGIRMHLSPEIGKPRNIGKYIMDSLFNQSSDARIPIVAVTGTNGKTTTVRLIASFAEQMGYCVGFTSTDGIYINNKLIYKGDCSGPISAATILREPSVNFAVLECARGGIINSGLGFDRCAISIVTNITEDHLGLNGIDTIEELAKVKSVVPKSTLDDGYAILNADDDLVYAMKEDINCRVALFSMDPNNIRIIEHAKNGGIISYLKEDHIIVQQGDLKKIIANVKDIPLTQFGLASMMIQNILAAVLAGVISKFELNKILFSLKNFSPTKTSPGRMNLFDFNNFKVLVDYGHNVGAFIELKKYLENIKSDQKIGIIGVPGDRRNEDIINMGYYSAQIFDKIIIRHDKSGRGRTNHEITSLIKQGIKRYNPFCNVNVISDEKKALEYALKNVQGGSLIAFFPEDVSTAIDYLNKYQHYH